MGASRREAVLEGLFLCRPSVGDAMLAPTAADVTDTPEGDRLVTTSRRLPRWLETALPVAVVALTVGMSALAYPAMPERMALHWRVGLDGAVRTGTLVSRDVGAFLLSPVSVATLLVGLLAVRRLRDREPTLARITTLLLVVVLVGFAAMQALLLGLNAR